MKGLSQIEVILKCNFGKTRGPLVCLSAALIHTAAVSRIQYGRSQRVVDFLCDIIHDYTNQSCYRLQDDIRSQILSIVSSILLLTRPAHPPIGSAAKKKQKPESMVAESLRMKGELEFTRLLRVDGRFEGELITDKGSLVVGPKGEVIGDLKNMQVGKNSIMYSSRTLP